MRDRLQNVPISSDIPNSPLTQTSATQPENVTENRDEQNILYAFVRVEGKTETKIKRIINNRFYSDSRPKAKNTEVQFLSGLKAFIKS